MQITLDRSGRDGIGLGCSRLCKKQPSGDEQNFYIFSVCSGWHSTGCQTPLDNFLPERALTLFVGSPQPRIGSVNCGQRQANATTRTTGCSLNVNRSEYSPARNGGKVLGRLKSPHNNGLASYLPAWTKQTRCAGSILAGPQGSRLRRNTDSHSENIRWSSRPRPVNRLQATSQPRRVMRGGSKSDTLGSKGTGQTRAGKAFAFSKGTGFIQHQQSY